MKSLKKEKVYRQGRPLGYYTLVVRPLFWLYLPYFYLFFWKFIRFLRALRVTKENTYALQGKAVAIGVDDHQEITYAIYQDGNVEFVSLLDGRDI